MTTRPLYRPRVFALEGLEPDVDVHDRLAAAALEYEPERRPVLLDSAAGWPRTFSLLAFDPARHELGSSLAELRNSTAPVPRAPDADPIPGPFTGGFVGALAYDLGVEGEGQELPPEPWGLPLVVGGVYTDFVVALGEPRGLFVVLAQREGEREDALRSRATEHLERLRTARLPRIEGAVLDGELERHTSAELHRARIEDARARIARGEFYQANLAHRFTAPVACGASELYSRLRAANPAPYAGFARWRGSDGHEAALCSSSPELLLELEPGLGRTRPIKGTIARGASPDEDRRAGEALLASAKDRAELAMIVDLERNDLGRTAEPGSVAVEEFPALRSYARVHHLTADVVARPRANQSAWDVLAALFPGGSVTGAPKLASMSAIAELEGEGRGFFCGGLGFVDWSGRARFNVLIRSLLWRARGSGGGEVSLRVGGGITWSSDAEQEDAETLAKAAGMLQALEGSDVQARRQEVFSR